MIEKEIEIINELGLHARAAAKLVSTAGQYSSEIFLSKGSQKINCKSIMGVMMLAASKGTLVTLHADGEDAQEAINGITELINNRFGEEQ